MTHTHVASLRVICCALLRGVLCEGVLHERQPCNPGLLDIYPTGCGVGVPQDRAGMGEVVSSRVVFVGCHLPRVCLQNPWDLALGVSDFATAPHGAKSPRHPCKALCPMAPSLNRNTPKIVGHRGFVFLRLPLLALFKVQPQGTPHFRGLRHARPDPPIRRTVR